MNPMKELETLAQYLRGACSASDNEKAANTFGEAAYRLDQIIQEIKQNHSRVDMVCPNV